MRYLGLDLGTKTCGVGISDKTNTIASPYTTIKYNENNIDYLYNELNKIIKKELITDIVIGDPINMDGSRGYATKRSDILKPFFDSKDISVHYIDERLTTMSALNILKETNIKYKKGKHLIDEMSACIILTDYLKRIKNE